MNPGSSSALAALKELEDSGFTSVQAECILRQSMEIIANNDLVTNQFLRAEMASTKFEMIKWMIGIQIAALCVIFTVLGIIVALIMTFLF